MKTLSPIVTVDTIEPCLPFWTEMLGFQVTISVPGAEGLDFAAVEKDGIEVMYQTRRSMEADLPALAAEMAESTCLFFTQVEDLNAVMAAVEGVEIVVPRRRTFYGMEEVFVRAPCGSVVGFAQTVQD
jgi:uncharacterized glyoxalase superfamily protein PhnB